MKKGYNGYLIPENERSKLLSAFPPKYSKVMAHHITHKFKVKGELPPPADMAKVIGYADSGDGLEVLVVEINGSASRPEDETLYHITLSLDPSKYKPKDSNTLLKNQGYKNINPLLIKVEPKFFPF